MLPWQGWGREGQWNYVTVITLWNFGITHPTRCCFPSEISSSVFEILDCHVGIYSWFEEGEWCLSSFLCSQKLKSKLWETDQLLSFLLMSSKAKICCLRIWVDSWLLCSPGLWWALALRGWKARERGQRRHEMVLSGRTGGSSGEGASCHHGRR